MATKQDMRRAGRKIRKAFDNYVAALIAAEEAGINVFTKTAQVDPDGNAISEPNPMDIHIASLPTLRNIEFWFAYTERLNQAELEDETDAPA